MKSIIKFFRHWQLTSHLSTRILPKLAPFIVMVFVLVLINTLVQVLAENMSPANALWLSMTTVTTVGYGDFSPVTFWGRLSMVLTMYGPAISLFSFVAAFVVEQRIIKRDRKLNGYWEWKALDSHVQIIHTPDHDTERFLLRLVSEIQQSSLANKTIQILSSKYANGLPESLVVKKVLHRTGRAEDSEILNHINLDKATHIIVLARDGSSSLSDSVTLDVLMRIREINAHATVVVEAVNDNNKPRLFQLGATAVIRPIRAYPEMLVRALSDPGSERVLEELFNVGGVAPYSVALAFGPVTWKEVLLACIEVNAGTPLGYQLDGDVITHPNLDRICTGDGLIILKDKQRQIDKAHLSALLSGLKSPSN